MSALFEVLRIALKVVVVVAVITALFGTVLSALGFDAWDVYEHFFWSTTAPTALRQNLSWICYRLDWPFLRGSLVALAGVWGTAAIVRLTSTTIQRA